MKILILAQYYRPEDVGAGVWIPQLAEDLLAKGHHVTVLTAFPNYPKRIVFREYKGRLYQREQINGVEVIRTWIYANPSESYWSRALNWGSFCLSASIGGLFSQINVDVIYALLPPLPLGMVALLLGKKYGAKVVINVQDIYPLIAVQLGILKNGFIIGFFKWMERFIYRNAEAVVGISEGFVQHIRQNGGKEDQVFMVPNWADSESIKMESPQTSLRMDVGGGAKTVTLYSGSLSYNSCTEVIVQAAGKIDDPSILFLIVGDGVKKGQLQKYVQEANLENVIFMPFQSLDRYPEVLATGDIAFVTLNTAATLASVPSKVFKHMASGRPIIAITKSGNELERLVSHYKIGIVADPDDIDGVVNAISRLSNDREMRERMGANARSVVENYFTRTICTNRIETIIREL